MESITSEMMISEKFILTGNSNLTASQRESEVLNAMFNNLLGGDLVLQETTAEVALA